MSYSRLILKDSPEIIWPFDDIKKESSASSLPIQLFTRSPELYAASVVSASTNIIDIPIIFGGGISMALRGSASPVVSVPLLNRLSELYANDSYAIEFWLKVDKAVPQEITVCKKRGWNNVGLFLKENYLIFRYGNSSEYYEVINGITNLSEPTHIVMNFTPNSIGLIVNGIQSQTTIQTEVLDSTSSSSIYNYLDFYGSKDYDFIIDSVAIYSYAMDEKTAKRHYIYGIGKNVNESIFFTLNGDYYNFSTDSTRKSYYQYWDFPEEWQLIRYDNLIHTENGITTRQFANPILTLDDQINKTSNRIIFSSSAGPIIPSWIDFTKINTIIPDIDNIFMSKITFNGELPSTLRSQYIMTYAIKDGYESLVNFTLYNQSGSYILNILNNVDGTTASFSIPNITSSPTAYIGMKYDDVAVYYFALSGSPVQTASYSTAGYYIENLASKYSPNINTVIRIGNEFAYPKPSISKQFCGTFHKLVSFSNNFSPSTYSDIESASAIVYESTYSTALDRMKIKTYGNANFIIHGARLSDSYYSSSAYLVANRFEFGYPDVVSGSQVKIYATLYDYDQNIISPKVSASSINFFNWLNYINLSDKYLRFDIDITADDAVYYPPIVRSFKGETYSYTTASYVEIYDNGGELIRIYPDSSGYTYIPEFDETYSIFLTSTSGIKVKKNIVDVTFNPRGESINILTGSPIVRLDSRFTDYFTSYSDSSSGTWYNLISSSYNATASIAYPEFRVQSLNLLKLNQSNGGEDGTASGIFTNAASLYLTEDGAVAGQSSFGIQPDGTSNDSYIYLDSNTGASFTGGLFSSGSYTIVASLVLDKIQENTSLNSNARAIVVTPYINSVAQTAIVSNQAPNAVGTHSLSVNFSLASTINGATIRLMNGSSSPTDVVYYDNIALYSRPTTSSSYNKWYFPLELEDDRPVLKFNGSNQFLSSSITLNQPITIYAVVRGFGDNNAFVGRTASAPSLYSSAGFYRMFAGAQLTSTTAISSSFVTLVGVFNGTTSSLYVNDSIVSGNAGSGSITTFINMGHRTSPAGSVQYLKGDIASILIYNAAHNADQIQEVREWLGDAFNV